MDERVLEGLDTERCRRCLTHARPGPGASTNPGWPPDTCTPAPLGCSRYRSPTPDSAARWTGPSVGRDTPCVRPRAGSCAASDTGHSGPSGASAAGPACASPGAPGSRVRLEGGDCRRTDALSGSRPGGASGPDPLMGSRWGGNTPSTAPHRADRASGDCQRSLNHRSALAHRSRPSALDKKIVSCILAWSCWVSCAECSASTAPAPNTCSASATASSSVLDLIVHHALQRRDRPRYALLELRPTRSWF